MLRVCLLSTFFFFNDTATTEIYTLSLHDALPISLADHQFVQLPSSLSPLYYPLRLLRLTRSEEHTSELQSRLHLVCRLLLEKKKYQHTHHDVRHPDPVQH